MSSARSRGWSQSIILPLFVGGGKSCTLRGPFLLDGGSLAQPLKILVMDSTGGSENWTTGQWNKVVHLEESIVDDDEGTHRERSLNIRAWISSACCACNEEDNSAASLSWVECLDDGILVDLILIVLRMRDAQAQSQTGVLGGPSSTFRTLPRSRPCCCSISCSSSSSSTSSNRSNSLMIIILRPPRS